MKHRQSGPAAVLFRGPEQGDSREKQVDAKGFPKDVDVDTVCNPGSGEGGGHGKGHGVFQAGLIKAVIPGVAEEGACGSGKEEEQVNALSGAVADAKEKGHHKEQKRSAADAPGRNNTGAQTAEKGQNPISHSR